MAVIQPLTDEPKYRAARAVAITAGVFSIIMCTLLLATFLQLLINDPLDSPVVIGLEQRLRENPDEQGLRQEIRALDLMARKAYFTSQWQIQTGSFMLLAGIVVLLLALKTMGYPRAKGPDLSQKLDEKKRDAARSRQWVAATGVIVLMIGLVVILTSKGRSDLEGKPGSSLPTAEDLDNNWTNFRGPGGNGIASADTAPTSWDGESGDGILWKVEVPLEGFSSPVVWQDQVILTGAGKKVQEVFSFDAATGAIKWRTEIKDVPGHPQKVPRVDQATGYAAPSVATDGRSIFATFATGDIAGLKMDGSIIWSRNLGLPDNHYGHSASLLVYENLVIVQFDQRSDSKLLGLNVATGDTVWRAPRTVISWSSPIIVNTGERDELILTNSDAIDSFDPKTGLKLWGLDVLGGEMGPSAAYSDGWVFAANDYASAVGIKLSASEATLEWEFDETLPDTASPVATEDFVFLATAYGVIVCLDAKSGEFIWEHEFDDGFYASPVIIGNSIFLMDMGGIMHIFEIADSYKPISDPELGEDSVCTPALVDGRLYLRGNKHLFCIGT